MQFQVTHVIVSLFSFAALVACDTPATNALLGEPAIVQSHEKAPPGAAPGTCWGKDVTPAVIETVTDRTLIQSSEALDDGTIISNPVYKLETRQAIVKERRDLWFEVPCDDKLTPDFVASVQRALAARGLYRGAVTGEMDSRTRRAIRRFQAPQGIDSGILSLASARKMGLVAIERPDAE